MCEDSDKTGKGLDDSEQCLVSHTKRPKESSSPEQDGDAATSQTQDSSLMITPATLQPSNTSPNPPSSSGSERTLTADSPVVMVSPYRVYEGDRFPPVTFSKDLLIQMDHNKHHLEIDLLRPECDGDVFPPQDLSPLCLYRELRTLKITGMMRSYQSYIWLVVWLNPRLTDLTLEMAGEAEPLDVEAIAEAQRYATCKPTMREVAQGQSRTDVPMKFQIVKLGLTNFVLHDAPFHWFSHMKLQNVELHRCKDAGFQLPTIMQRSFNLTLTA